jgi:hypothetical protein
MINPSILLQGRAPQINDPLEGAARMISLSEMMRQAPIREELQQHQLQAARLGIQQTERDMKESDDFRAAVGAGKSDQELMGISPTRAMAYGKSKADMRKSGIDAEESQIKLLHSKAERLGSLAGSAVDQSSYQNAIFTAVKEGLIPTEAAMKLPGKYDPAVVQQFMQQALSVKDQRELELKAIAEKRTAELHPYELAAKAAGAVSAQQKAEGREPIQPYQRETLLDADQNRVTTERGQNMTQATARAGQAITVRGQNMTDVRARELNDINRVNKPATAGERHNLGFYMRANEADQKLQAGEPEMAGKGLGGQAYYALAPNWAQTKSNQAYKTAQRQFTEARLRKDSGAAIPDHEFESDAKMYFPQPGDDKTVLAQKAAARKTILRTLRIASGNAMRDIGEEPGDFPQAPQAPTHYEMPEAAKAITVKGGAPKIKGLEKESWDTLVKRLANAGAK